MKKIKENLILARRSFSLALMVFLGKAVTYAQSSNLGQQVLDQTTQSLKQLVGNIVSLLRVVMGIGALVVLAIVIFKVFKGDREAAEKLAWWVAGLAIGFTLLSVVQNNVFAVA